jgi:predicted nucleotidyltransferase/HEPN domain-containing protein
MYKSNSSIYLYVTYLYHSWMKTSREHLPEQKQQDLSLAIDIICDEIQPEMLILFGSYARGDWVEDLDPDTLQYRYQSDFDLLVVTDTTKEARNINANRSLHQRLIRHVYKTPISLIAEDIKFINKRLRNSQYFYIDIQREGILLHDTGKLKLAEPKDLTAKQRGKLAQEDFDYWFTSAQEFFIGYQDALAKGFLNKSAFELHQATERLYSTILLTFTRYKPNTHDLEKLNQRVTSVEPKFLNVFLQDTSEYKQRFELLRKAYVDARYKPSYSITTVELAWLAERIQTLQELTAKLCKQKIASFS